MSFIGNLFKGNQYKADTGSTGADVAAARAQSLAAQQQQQAFVNATGAQNGLANQSDVYNQLSGIAAGTGPNPAQAMLSQATGANVANQAALTAGQRGVNANPGMIARQAANAGAGIQQQAVGQGAVLQANQSMNAINSMGGLANQQVAQQQGALNSLNNQAQGQQSLNQAGATAGSQINAGVAAQNEAEKMGAINGVTGAIAKGAMMLADGGSVPAIADISGGAKSNVAKQLSSPTAPAKTDEYQAGENMGNALVSATKAIARPAAAPVYAPSGGGAGKVGSVLSPMLAQGGNVGGKLKTGGKVPGKPKVGGAVNSYANDTVDAKLSPGEVVIPRSVMMGKDPVNGAAQFVAAIMSKQGLKGKKK